MLERGLEILCANSASSIPFLGSTKHISMQLLSSRFTFTSNEGINGKYLWSDRSKSSSVEGVGYFEVSIHCPLFIQGVLCGNRFRILTKLLWKPYAKIYIFDFVSREKIITAISNVSTVTVANILYFIRHKISRKMWEIVHCVWEI
jgi:hypothetical protein